MPCTHRLLTAPATGQSAIAIVELSGDVDTTLRALGVRAAPLGSAVLRTVPGVDTLVLARFRSDHALLFPHAGKAVLERLMAALQRAGSTPPATPANDLWPEAADNLASHMLDALSRAASPLAIDLLLDQPRRWAASGSAPAPLSALDSLTLRRLIDPPLVLLLGPPNIGKSTLLNALAGRAVSIVADLPGTTRDHVGVAINFAGLVCRCVDAPGLDSSSDPLLAEAQRIALDLAGAADLILLCSDPATPPLPLHPHLNLRDLTHTTRILRVQLRTDIPPISTPHPHPHPHFHSHPPDIAVSVHRAQGLETLTRQVRDMLLPPDLLANQGAWTFW